MTADDELSVSQEDTVDPQPPVRTSTIDRAILGAALLVTLGVIGALLMTDRVVPDGLWGVATFVLGALAGISYPKAT